MITKDLIVENTSLEEFFSIINDLVKNTKVQKMKIYNQHAHTSCYKHCMQVAYYTYIICKKLNLDYVSATRGAMLHDLFLYDWHTYIREDKSWKGQHAFMHPKFVHNMVFDYLSGNYTLAKDSQIKSISLIDSLFCETNPIPIKSALSMMDYDSMRVRLPLVTMSLEKQKILETEMKKFNLI